MKMKHVSLSIHGIYKPLVVNSVCSSVKLKTHIPFHIYEKNIKTIGQGYILETTNVDTKVDVETRGKIIEIQPEQNATH